MAGFKYVITGHQEYRKEHCQQEHRQPHCHAACQLPHVRSSQVSDELMCYIISVHSYDGNFANFCLSGSLLALVSLT